MLKLSSDPGRQVGFPKRRFAKYMFCAHRKIDRVLWDAGMAMMNGSMLTDPDLLKRSFRSK
jgi:hypothetical protein